jgi:membrane protein YqaA with SNARE-associated domain
MTPEQRTRLLRWTSLVVVIGILAVIYLYRDQVKHLAQYGYAGIFVITAMSNATVFLPLPGVAVVFTMGAVFHPLITAIVAGCGAAVGELSGYLLGFSGQGLAERSERYLRLLDWMRRNERWIGWAIFALAAIPNPFFDLAGIAAGTLKIPVWRFLVFCTAGSILKMLAFAYAGQTGLGWIFGR